MNIQELQKRSGGKCEFCEATESLKVYEVAKTPSAKEERHENFKAVLEEFLAQYSEEELETWKDLYNINDIIIATSCGKDLKVLAKRLQIKEEFIDNMIKELDNGN